MSTSHRRFRRLVSGLAIACMLFLFVSCSSKPKDAIIGKWHAIDGTKTCEFFRDGSYTTNVIGGNYRFVDKNKLRLDVGGVGALVGPLILTVSISGDKMTVTDDDGSVRKYARVR